MKTSVRKCAYNCRHEFQDATYGAGKRVHNASGKSNEQRGDTCTACGRQASVSDNAVKNTVKV